MSCTCRAEKDWPCPPKAIDFGGRSARVSFSLWIQADFSAGRCRKTSLSVAQSLLLKSANHRPNGLKPESHSKPRHQHTRFQSTFLSVTERETNNTLPSVWRQIWRVAGGESGSPELLGSPRTSPEVPRTSPEVFGDFPGISVTVELNSFLQRFPGSFPNFPGSSPNFPGSSGTSPEVSPFLWEA